jgi:hypothetical protein
VFVTRLKWDGGWVAAILNAPDFDHAKGMAVDRFGNVVSFTAADKKLSRRQINSCR